MPIPPNKVFHGEDLELFLQCQKHIPILFKKIRLIAELVCYVNKDNIPSYYYVSIKSDQWETTIKCLASIHLVEMVKKCHLLEQVILLSLKNKIPLEKAVSKLQDKDGTYLAIYSDIETLEDIFQFNDHSFSQQLETISIDNVTVH